MAERLVNIGLASFIKADSPDSDGILAPQWGFGMLGDTVDVHASDVERFDRLNGLSAAVRVPLPEVEPVNDLIGSEPPRSGRGSSADAWVSYAEGLGLDVPDDSSRDDVVALVDESRQ